MKDATSYDYVFFEIFVKELFDFINTSSSIHPHGWIKILNKMWGKGEKI